MSLLQKRPMTLDKSAQVYRSVLLQCVAACCGMLQRVAACCDMLQCVAACCGSLHKSAQVYRVAKTRRIPYPYRSFSAKVTYI